jgi:hypothetical protein
MTQQNAINRSLTWINPTLQSNWVNYGYGLPPAAFCLNSLGYVQFTGVIANGVAGNVCTLPVGYRPKTHKGFRLFASDLQSYVIIYPSGDVSISLPTNSNTYVYLDNIFFPIY